MRPEERTNFGDTAKRDKIDLYKYNAQRSLLEDCLSDVQPNKQMRVIFQRNSLGIFFALKQKDNIEAYFQKGTVLNCKLKMFIYCSKFLNLKNHDIKR